MVWLDRLLIERERERELELLFPHGTFIFHKWHFLWEMIAWFPQITLQKVMMWLIMEKKITNRFGQAKIAWFHEFNKNQNEQYSHPHWVS